MKVGGIDDDIAANLPPDIYIENIYFNDKWVVEGSEVGVMGENYKFKGICDEGLKKDFLKI